MQLKHSQSVCLCIASLLLTTLAGCGSSDDAKQDIESSSPAIKVASAEEQNAPMTVGELKKALKTNDEAKFRKVGGEIVEAHLFNSGVTDISALEGVPLRFLDLGRCSIADISVIKGMPLKQLILEDTEVTDLSPVEGMQLEILYLQNTNVSDISMIAGMPLKQLNLLGTKVEDLSAIQGMPLEILWVPETPVSDLTQFSKTGMVSLDIRATAVTDLSPLVEMKRLERLNIVDCDIKDVSPLATMNLQRLLFTPSNVEKGMDELRKCKSLQKIGIDGIDVQSALSATEFWDRYDEGLFSKQPANQPDGESATQDDSPTVESQADPKPDATKPDATKPDATKPDANGSDATEQDSSLNAEASDTSDK